jgi:hypothetical protein
VSVFQHTSPSPAPTELFLFGPKRTRARAISDLEVWTSNSLRLDVLGRLLSGTVSHAPIEVEPVVLTRSQEDVLGRIKSASGLTWEQIARLVGVKRRSIHNWLNGGTIASEHEERLHALDSVIDAAAKGRSPHETRAWMRNRSNGASVVELFEAGMIDQALATAVGEAAFQVVARPIRRASNAKKGPFSALDLLETPAPVELPAPRVKQVIRVKRPRPDERD